MGVAMKQIIISNPDAPDSIYNDIKPKDIDETGDMMTFIWRNLPISVGRGTYKIKNMPKRSVS